MTAPTLHYPLDPVEWDTFLVAVEDAIRDLLNEDDEPDEWLDDPFEGLEFEPLE